MVRYVMIFFLLLSGCAGHSAEQSEVETGSPVVYIHPLTANLRTASVAVLPFSVPPGMNVSQGENVAALFQDVLLGKQAFHTVKMINRHYGQLTEAAAIAKESGTDLVLAGKIKHLLSGTRLGGGRVELSVRVIDVRSGDTVWYIEQAMEQKMDYPDVSLTHRLSSVFDTPPLRPSEGAPVVPNMLVHIAMDMADVMAGARQVAKMAANGE
ncbi:MAG: hypothetical protein HY885_12215 [Deltaproteobacteria bacterium]|nr:hypothetical protein [Deltaproteobacteria bacterium]